MTTMQIQNIAIVKMSALGDILQAFPSVYTLKKSYPNITITWFVDARYEQALKDLGWIDRVVGIDTKKIKKCSFNAFKKAIRMCRDDLYDLAFDLQSNTKSAMVMFFLRARKKVGYQHVSEWPASLVIDKKYESKLICTYDYYYDLIHSEIHHLPELQLELPVIKSKMPVIKASKKPCVMVCLNSIWENKKPNFAPIASILNQFGDTFTFLISYGSLKEKELLKPFTEKLRHTSVLLGEMTLSTWHQAMNACIGVITVDSASLALATMSQTPIFAIFGASNPKRYFYKRHRLDQCFFGECPYGVDFVTRCPYLRSCKSGACIKKGHDKNMSFKLAKWLVSLKSAYATTTAGATAT